MRVLLGSLVFAALANIAGAQQPTGPVVSVPSDEQVAPSVLTLDLDRLFVQSLYGQRIAQVYTQGREDLALENAQIFDALRAEELALADQRGDMDQDVFLAAAETFDAKAQGIRTEQDSKERALEVMLSSGRDQFLEVTRPIIGQMMVERRAYAVLDRRTVFLSLGSIDITDDALARVDLALGDGTTPDVPFEE